MSRTAIPATMIDPKASKISKEKVEKRIIIENSTTIEDNLRVPSWLKDSIARSEWRRMVKLYRQMEAKILCDLDLTALAMYCQAVSDYRHALDLHSKTKEKIDAGGHTTEELEQLCSMIAIHEKRMSASTKVVRSLSEQLCLTPLARARMGQIKYNGTGPDPLDELGF